MFSLMLSLHIIGAIASGVLVVGVAIAAAVQRGQIKTIKHSLATATVYQIGTGFGLVLIQPSFKSLTTFCISGMSALGIIALAYYVAKLRLTQVTMNQ